MVSTAADATWFALRADVSACCHAPSYGWASASGNGPSSGHAPPSVRRPSWYAHGRTPAPGHGPPTWHAPSRLWTARYGTSSRHGAAWLPGRPSSPRHAASSHVSDALQPVRTRQRTSWSACGPSVQTLQVLTMAPPGARPFDVLLAGRVQPAAAALLMFGPRCTSSPRRRPRALIQPQHCLVQAGSCSSTGKGLQPQLQQLTLSGIRGGTRHPCAQQGLERHGVQQQLALSFPVAVRSTSELCVSVRSALAAGCMLIVFPPAGLGSCPDRMPSCTICRDFQNVRKFLGVGVHPCNMNCA